MDILSELAPNYTPYRYGFNNPVFWSDPSGLFESWEAANTYRISHGLRDADIRYNRSEGLWEVVEDGKSTISQIGDMIYAVYEIGGEWIMEQTYVGGGDPAAKQKDPGYNPNGIVFTANTDRDGPVTPSRGPRDAPQADMSLLYFLIDAFLGPDTKVPYQTNYEKKKKKKQKQQTYKYDSYLAMPASTRNLYLLRPIERSVYMTPSEYHTTDFNAMKIIDSIQEVEKIKNHEPSRIHFEESIKNK